MEGTLKQVLKGERQWHLICGDVVESLKTIPDGVVHCTVTSPPYYGLRSYLPAGHTDKDKEIGLEETPAAYIARMVEVFREVRRVLHETGVCWVNIGDSYSSGCMTGKQGPNSMFKTSKKNSQLAIKLPPRKTEGFSSGNLLGIPHRLAHAMQSDGWILRADVAWVKAAAMPESVSGWRWERCRVKVKNLRGRGTKPNPNRGDWGHSNLEGNPWAEWSPCPGCPKCGKTDGLILRRGSWRPTRAHEHVFLFAKSERYFADGEAVRTKLEEATKMRDTYSRIAPEGSKGRIAEDEGVLSRSTVGLCGDHRGPKYAVKHDHETPSNPAGANLRDWWLLKQQALDEGHYAAFPPSLPAMCVKAGTSQRGACSKCGMPWARVVERESFGKAYSATKFDNTMQAGPLSRSRQAYRAAGMEGPPAPKTLGWRPTCSCDAGKSIPALVLDPFSGSGTTGLVCQKLGRRYIGIDLSEEYIEIARRRIRRRGHGKAPKKDQKKEPGGFFS